MRNELDKDLLLGYITAILIIVLGIVVPSLISEKRNIEKEITLKQIEVYGEPVNLDKGKE